MISVKSDPNTALFPTPSTAAILLWSDLTGEGVKSQSSDLVGHPCVQIPANAIYAALRS